jgi:ribosomal protein S10
MATQVANLKEMEKRLKDLASKINDLEDKVKRRHSEAESHMEQVATLQSKHKSAREILEQFEKSTHQELTTLKSGWEEIVKDMQELMDRIASSY